MDVNTISGFSFDSCDILSSFVPIVFLSLCIDYVSLLILPYIAAFPPVALPTFNGTMQLSDWLHSVCLPFFIGLSGIPFIH